MKILLVYPQFPDTFWSFKHALSFVGKRSAFPPLGLLTVAAMLPDEWDVRLVDLNVTQLRKRDLAWADCAFVSGMTVQRPSAVQAIQRCKAAGLLVVAGGPLFTLESEAFEDVDHFVLNEAEITFPLFLADLLDGDARRVYATSEFPDVRTSSLPRWDLVDMRRYATMAIQYTRGCPFNCDFCNVTSLFGHRVRTKSTDQVIAELDGLYDQGWRGRIFFVDDNFIGNKHRLKTDLLPALIAWQRDKKNITFQTEASINLADDGELMELMARAGFHAVFVGIESPDEASLAECNKHQNENRDLVEDVKRIHRAGLQVQGGFIVGFDNDQPSVFQRQIDFIQRSGIVTAMVGILQAPIGTKLYKRMEAAGRLRGSMNGDNVDGTTNIVPAMDFERLYRGYRSILNHVYAPRHYYQRVRTFLREYRVPRVKATLSRADIRAFLRSLYRLGIFGRERLEYWKLVLWTAVRKPALLPLAVTLAIYGHHFRKVCELHVQ